MGEVSGSDLLQDAVADLYAGDPDEFVARRGELAARARAAGDAAAARQIAGLRKPTRSAWVVNRLARAEPGAADQLAELGAQLRAAQQALDGRGIRQLSQRRRELVDTLARDAFRAVGQRSPSATLREEVVTTLSAVLVDPEVAGLMRAGRLERVVSRDGLSPEPGTAARPSVIPLRPGRRAAAGGATSAGGGAGRGGAAGGGGAGPARSPAKVTALAAARARAERAKAERARADRERRRKAIVAAEQVVARADRAERSAARTEKNSDDTVRLLEAELTEARQRLAEARLQARRARTQQRQARRALERLQDAPED
jgi:hypothetical protein